MCGPPFHFFFFKILLPILALIFFKFCLVIIFIGALIFEKLMLMMPVIFKKIISGKSVFKKIDFKIVIVPGNRY